MGFLSDFVGGITGSGSAKAATKGGKQLSQGALDAAESRELGILKGLSEQEAFGREGIDALRSNLDPFANAFRSDAIQGLRELATDPNQQAQFIQNNPFFDALRNQARESTFRAQGVKGDIGGSGTDQILQNDFLALGNDLVDKQINRQLPLFGAAQNAATNIGTGSSSILNRIGDTRFAGQSAIGEAQGAGQEQSAQALATGRIGAANARAKGAMNIIGIGSAALSGGMGGGGAGGAAGGVASLFSDERLKTDIEKIGSKSGINVYSWKWNDLAESIGLIGKGVGHIAQQVKDIHPELVTEAANGFLMINYSTPKTVRLN